MMSPELEEAYMAYALKTDDGVPVGYAKDLESAKRCTETAKSWLKGIGCDRVHIMHCPFGGIEEEVGVVDLSRRGPRLGHRLLRDRPGDRGSAVREGVPLTNIYGHEPKEKKGDVVWSRWWGGLALLVDDPGITLEIRTDERDDDWNPVMDLDQSEDQVRELRDTLTAWLKENGWERWRGRRTPHPRG